jgi:hypothetical protein
VAGWPPELPVRPLPPELLSWTTPIREGRWRGKGALVIDKVHSRRYNVLLLVGWAQDANLADNLDTDTPPSGRGVLGQVQDSPCGYSRDQDRRSLKTE